MISLDVALWVLLGHKLQAHVDLWTHLSGALAIGEGILAFLCQAFPAVGDYLHTVGSGLKNIPADQWQRSA